MACRPSTPNTVACLKAVLPPSPAPRSATSGVSGTSGLSDGDGTGDFKRGKRYKKLIKLIDSPDSKKVRARPGLSSVPARWLLLATPDLQILSLQSLSKFKMLVAAVIFTCMAVHILCFALIMDGIHVSILASEMNAYCNPVTVPRWSSTRTALVTVPRG